MLAIRVYIPGDANSLKIEELPLPTPGPGELRIQARAIGVGGADILIRKGTYKWMPPLPAIPGMELSGIVDALGEGVTEWQLGQRVLLSSRDLPQRGGCYSQSVVVSKEAPYLIPDTISFADAVSLPNLQLALALFRAADIRHFSTSKNVLITGASGGVATMLAQVARCEGFTTIGTSRSVEKASYALSMGFDKILGANPQTLKDQVMEITNGNGVQLAYDHLGGTFFPACIRSLSNLGFAISYNITSGKPSEDVFSILRELLGKSLGIRCFSMHSFDEDRNNRRQLMQEAIRFMAQGQIKAPSARLMKFPEIKIAHELLETGNVLGKIVLDPNN
jgi:NADPH2:quinone reductase